jgi:hypothetical protein
VNPALREHVDAVLRAIDDDTPDFAPRLRKLAGDADALEGALDDPLMSRLVAELRKLRRVALWVRDESARALHAKRSLLLDGAICLLSPGETALPPVGRECWVELSAEAREGTLASLPPGYGICLRGPVHDLTLPIVRRAAPLRALGVAMARASDVPEVRLDLVVYEHGEPAEVRRRGGARALCAGLAPEHVTLTAIDQGLGGVVCEAAQAFAWSLRLAAHRPTSYSHDP